MGILRGRKTRKHDTLVNDEQLARLEKAERDVQTLKERAGAAMRTLDTRDRRNHWQESVAAVIRGVL